MGKLVGPRSMGPLLLALSLGLNLFLGGWWLTQGLAAAHRDGAKPDPAPETVAEAIADELPSSDAAILRRAIDEKRLPLKDARRDYLAAFQRLRQVIATEPLDEAGLRDALERMRAARQAERVLFGDTIIFDVIPRLSPAGRQAFVATHLGGRQ